MVSHAPEVAIIGAMKCATTTLHYQLEQHCDICGSKSKEVDFFSQDKLWSNGSSWNDAQFPGYRPGQLRLDSSPNCTKRHLFPMSAERLAAINPAVRLIYIVREPIARLKSHWVHSVSAGRERRDLDSIATDVGHNVVQTSRYHWQLQPFLDHFNIEQLLVLRFEDVVGLPVATLERVFAHLGVPHQRVAVSEVGLNSSSDKTRPSSLASLLRSPRARNILRQVHPRLADRALTIPPLSAAAEAATREYLRPDLEALQATNLVDVSDWIQ